MVFGTGDFAVKSKLITGLDSLWIDYHYDCNACKLAKMTRIPINNPSPSTSSSNIIKNSSIPICNHNSKSIVHNNKLLQYIPNKTLVKFAVDLKGPLPISFNHNVYCFLFTSCISRYRFVYFIKHKSDTIGIFKKFLLTINRLQMEASFEFKDKKQIQSEFPEAFHYLIEHKFSMDFKSDNGSEFVNQDVQQLFQNNNIYIMKNLPPIPPFKMVLQSGLIGLSLI